jgi:hypothetical protein
MKNPIKRVHLDHPWAKCVREDGAPLRAYIHLRSGGCWIVALWPGNKTQGYDRRAGKYTDDWRWVAYRP